MHLLFSLILLLPHLAYSNPEPAIVRSTIRRASITAKHYGERARLLALKQRKNRRVSDGADWTSDEFDLTNLEPDVMCPILEFLSTDTVDDFYADDYFANDYFDDLFMCEIGCDQTQENIVMTCEGAEEICEETGEFCVKDIRITTIMSLDFESATVENCMTYTNVPTNSEFTELNGKEACISIDANIDAAAVFSGIDAEEDIDITECDFTLDGDICQCDVCDNGIGVYVGCPSMGLLAEECADIEETSPTFFNGGESSYTDANDSTSIVRFTKVEPWNSSPVIRGTLSIGYVSFVALTFAALLL